MQNRFFYAIVGFLIILIVSCAPKQSELVVAEYGEYEIKMDEFEKAYAKNVGSYEMARKDSIENFQKFLDLYVNFKMKLRDAHVRGLPNDESIVNELKSYEKTIGASYLLENELFKKGLKILYDKRSEELRVSHLLIRTDTLTDEQANKKALDIIDQINDGSQFEDEVKKHSDDQFSKNKGGDIYYITAGMIMPEFEEMAYGTPVGTVNPTPLKTKYGYHIIKVTERKKRTPKIQASHILIKNESAAGIVDDKSRIKLANDLLDRAKIGEDFGALAATYSDDPGSKQKNGDLGYFGRRQMVQPFDEAAFNLGVGEISDLVETQFGFHIIKVTGKEEYPSFEDEKKNLRDLFEKTRRKSDYDALVEKYGKEVNLIMHDEVLKNVVSNLGDMTLDKDYLNSDLSKNYGSSVIFTIGNDKFTTDSLFTYGLKDSKMLGKPLDAKSLDELNDKFKDDKIIERKAKDLVRNDAKFASLMDEYKNGILIFRLQEDEVWNGMKMDSVKIFELYQDTKESYIWPDRVQFVELFTKSDSLANVYHEMLINGAEFDTLLTKYNEKKGIKTSNEGLIDASANTFSIAAFELNNEGDYSKVIKTINGWSILKLVNKDPSRIKTFDEARAEVTSAYQDIESAELENSYVSRLNKVYSPTLFYEELENAYKK
jgi:peptidyl-prolyl cis-trans isomerase SurA